MMTRALRLLTLGLIASVAASADNPGAASVGKWRAGTNYNVVPSPQQQPAARGRVDVNEVFWYGCGHCYALDPTLENWRETKTKYIDFRRTPVMWGPPHRQHAKLFYSIQALGRTDLHPKVFDAIHREGQLLATNNDDAAARAMHLAFLKNHGVSEKDFNAAYDSEAVAKNLERAQEITQRFTVGSVPMLIVNGKYTTTVTMAGGTPGNLLSLIDDLAASERAR